MKAIIENAAASARTVFLVNPNGTTRASTLSKAPNGAIREGNAKDVICYASRKMGRFTDIFSQQYKE